MQSFLLDVRTVVILPLNSYRKDCRQNDTVLQYVLLNLFVAQNKVLIYHWNQFSGRTCVTLAELRYDRPVTGAADQVWLLLRRWLFAAKCFCRLELF